MIRASMKEKSVYKDLYDPDKIVKNLVEIFKLRSFNGSWILRGRP